MAECVGRSLNVELNKEIDNSINDLMKKNLSQILLIKKQHIKLMILLL